MHVKPANVVAMAAFRKDFKIFFLFYVFLTLFLTPATSQISQGDYYRVEGHHHVDKRGVSEILPKIYSTQVTTASPLTAVNSSLLSADAPGKSSNVSSSAVASPTTNSSVATDYLSTTTNSSTNGTTTADGDDNSFPLYPNNQTFSEHHINKTEEDHHKYYNSTFTVDQNISHYYWVEMNNRTDVKVSELLSKSHRRAATIRLSFEFPFYGHLVRNVTIATGGFLYMGDYVHSWLAATQYIAPLMANFDTSLFNTSFVKYVDNGTALTVQWEKVVLKDKPESGNFTFQVTLHSTGDIVFVYQQVPVQVEAIQDEYHPVKVGLSDAYIVDRTIFFVRRKTIYEYHRLQLGKENIQNYTVIYLYALPTCIELKDCHTCLSQSIGFECQWCPSANRCSDGMDRFRQDWMSQECHNQNLSRVDQCQQILAPSVLPTAEANNDQVPREKPLNSEEQAAARSGFGTIVVFLVSGVIVLMFIFWVTYAYRNPHTASGQILIRYRPSQWRWRRGEARYTAATIHM